MNIPFIFLFAASALLPYEMINDGGNPITIDEWENPCPVPADWDGDERKDLIVEATAQEFHRLWTGTETDSMTLSPVRAVMMKPVFTFI